MRWTLLLLLCFCLVLPAPGCMTMMVLETALNADDDDCYDGPDDPRNVNGRGDDDEADYAALLFLPLALTVDLITLPIQAPFWGVLFDDDDDDDDCASHVHPHQGCP